MQDILNSNLNLSNLPETRSFKWFKDINLLTPVKFTSHGIYQLNWTIMYVMVHLRRNEWNQQICLTTFNQWSIDLTAGKRKQKTQYWKKFQHYIWINPVTFSRQVNLMDKSCYCQQVYMSFITSQNNKPKRLSTPTTDIHKYQQQTYMNT